MNLKQTIGALLGISALAMAAPGMAQTQTGLNVKDANGAPQTLCDVTSATGTVLVQCANVYEQGAQISPSNPLDVKLTTAPLPAGAAADAHLTNVQSAAGTAASTAVGVQGVTGGVPIPVTGAVTISGTPAVTISGTPALGAGSAAIGTVGVTSMPALSAGTAAIGSINNLSFGAKLQDATGNAFGTSGNPLVVSGGGGGGTPTGAAGTPNAAVVSIQGVVGGIPQPVSGSVSISGTPALGAGSAAIGTVGVTSLPALSAGSAAIGAITNTGFGITGTLPAFTAPPTFNIGTAPSLTIGTLPALVASSANIGTVNLGTIAGVATAANQVSVQSAPGTSASTGLTVQGSASGVPLPVSVANSAATYALTSTPTSFNGGNYLLNIAGTFGGTTLTLTQTINGQSSTVGQFTSAPAAATSYCVGQGTQISETTAGGSPSGISVIMAGTGPGSCLGPNISAIDGGIVSMGSTGDAAYSGSGSASLVAAEKGIYNRLGSLSSNVQGIYNSTPVACATSGAACALAVDLYGHMPIGGIYGPNGNGPVSTGGPADASSNGLSGLYVNTHGLLWNDTTWDRAREVTSTSLSTGLGVSAVAFAPSSAVGAGITPGSSSALAASLVIKPSAGNLYELDVTNLAASIEYVMLLNSATTPADGAVTPVKCWIIPATSSAIYRFRETPMAFSVGIDAVLSSTGCFTKTASTNGFFSGDVK